MLLRIGNIVPAMALFEIIEGMNLAGHLEPILINRVMPAFDVYAAYEPAPPQFRSSMATESRPARLSEASEPLVIVVQSVEDAPAATRPAE